MSLDSMPSELRALVLPTPPAGEDEEREEEEE